MNTLVKYQAIGRPCKQCGFLFYTCDGDYMLFKCGRLGDDIDSDLVNLGRLPLWCPDVVHVMLPYNEQN